MGRRGSWPRSSRLPSARLGAAGWDQNLGGPGWGGWYPLGTAGPRRGWGGGAGLGCSAGAHLPCPSEAHKEHGALSCSHLLWTHLSGALSQAGALLGAPVL